MSYANPTRAPFLIGLLIGAISGAAFMRGFHETYRPTPAAPEQFLTCENYEVYYASGGNIRIVIPPQERDE